MRLQVNWVIGSMVSNMKIREAIPKDNHELQEVQAKCLQGKEVIVSIVNRPDFFARARAYEAYKVYVACEDGQIVGSGAVGLRESLVNGKKKRVGYEFQYFTSPDHRRKGVGRTLHRKIEDYLTRHGVALSYLLIMEDNVAPKYLFESEGFRLHRTALMPIIMVNRALNLPSTGNIRKITADDLDAVVGLLNETWEGHDLYEPKSVETLAGFIDRTPAYDFGNVFILEDQGKIVACLGFWDWSQIARITIEAVNVSVQRKEFVEGFSHDEGPVPEPPKPGTTLKQWCLTPIGFQDPECLKPLIRYVNNLAMNRGIGQIFFLSERDHALLQTTEGLFRRDVGIHLYVKILQEISIGERPIFLDGIDL